LDCPTDRLCCCSRILPSFRSSCLRSACPCLPAATLWAAIWPLWTRLRALRDLPCHTILNSPLGRCSQGFLL